MKYGSLMRLFLKFLETVRANFDKNYSLADIAGKLGTTEAKLNEQSKLHTGGRSKCHLWIDRLLRPRDY
jgi:hypothetical protein